MTQSGIWMLSGKLGYFRHQRHCFRKAITLGERGEECKGNN